MENYECLAPVDLFARILVYPNHFNVGVSKKGDNLNPLKSLFPRPDSDKDGISIIKCSEIKFGDLIKQGENIVKNQRRKKDTPELSFYGILFILEGFTNQSFDLLQKGNKSYHYVLKHKEVNYKEFFPFDNMLLIGEHNLLLEDSLVKTASELEDLAKTPNNWEIIRQELVKLTQI